MKVKMKENLVERYRELFPGEVDSECEDFLRSIDGKVIDVCFTGDDAFEANDDNYWLPEGLWVKVEV